MIIYIFSFDFSETPPYPVWIIFGSEIIGRFLMRICLYTKPHTTCPFGHSQTTFIPSLRLAVIPWKSMGPNDIQYQNGTCKFSKKYKCVSPKIVVPPRNGFFLKEWGETVWSWLYCLLEDSSTCPRDECLVAASCATALRKNNFLLRNANLHTNQSYCDRSTTLHLHRDPCQLGLLYVRITRSHVQRRRFIHRSMDKDAWISTLKFLK